MLHNNKKFAHCSNDLVSPYVADYSFVQAHIHFAISIYDPLLQESIFLYFTLLYFTLLYFLYFTLLYFTLLYFTLLYFTFLCLFARWEYTSTKERHCFLSEAILSISLLV